MTQRALARRLVPLAAAAAFALALAAVVVSRAGWFHRFEVDGVKINPRAPVRDDVTYDLVVWEEAVVAPWAKETHAEHLERAVLEFSRQRPNVRVTVQMLDEETARERLEAAVAAGAPPDVYGAVKGVLWAWPYQVPASPYMPVDQGAEPLPVDPRALAGLTAAGAVWGWPRGLWWDGWLGRRELAISDDWTYGSLLQGGTGPSSSDRITVSLDLTSVQLLEQLMGAAGTPSYVDGHGQGAWDRSGLAETAAFLRSLQQSRGPGGDMDAAARRRLENLLAGDVDLIGPVNPYAVQSALRHAPDRLIIVPPPGRPGSPPAWPVAVSGYFVFRQHDYKGDDHTRLAAELAAFLAKKTETWLVESVGLLPVSAEGRDVWRERAPWDAANRDVLAAAAEHAVVAPPWAAQVPVDSIRSAPVPPWRAFIAGDTTPERFAEDAIRAIQRALSAGR